MVHRAYWVLMLRVMIGREIWRQLETLITFVSGFIGMLRCDYKNPTLLLSLQINHADCTLEIYHLMWVFSIGKSPQKPQNLAKGETNYLLSPMGRHLLSSITRVVSPGRKSELARLTLCILELSGSMQELVPLGGDYHIHGTPHSAILQY